MLAALAVASCESATGLSVDPALYEPLPQVEELGFGEVFPARLWPYWELRFSWGVGAPADSIVGSGGALAREELSPEVLERLDALELPTGFAGGCLPSWCFKFVVAVDEAGELVTFTTPQALRDFLAPVASLEEAVLLLDAHGFTWHGEGHGIRAVEPGWEALVLELVRDCDPIQTDRVLVRVMPEGELDILGREVWSRMEGACI